MTTFQAILYAALHGFSEILPLGSAAHRILLSFMTGWPEPSGALLGAFSLGSLLAVFIFFIHDWASMVSCFLQILIYRKKPMTLDERMPIFLGIASVPIAIAWYYLHERVATQLDSSPLIVAAMLAGFGLLLWLTDSMSRRTKKMYDWSTLDSIIVGVAQIGALLPGCGRSTAVLTTGLFRNFSRESAAKFGFFTALPVLAGSAFVQLREVSFFSAAPMTEVSWLSFYVSLVVAFFASLLAINAFMKHIQRGGMGQYVAWRLIVATATVATYWWRSRG